MLVCLLVALQAPDPLAQAPFGLVRLSDEAVGGRRDAADDPVQVRLGLGEVPHRRHPFDPRRDQRAVVLVAPRVPRWTRRRRGIAPERPLLLEDLPDELHERRAGVLGELPFAGGARLFWWPAGA